MKPAILFLEPKGTVLEVVRAAKKRGYVVIAMVSDPGTLESAPLPYRTAVELIDEVVAVAGWNAKDLLQEAFSELMTRFDIRGVYTGVDPCVVTAASLREQLGLPTPSPENMEIILDKYKLRTRLRELGLSSLRNFRGTEVNEWTDWRLGSSSGYFKPVHGFYSAYVRKCSSLADLGEARTAWKNGVNDESQFVRNYLLSKNEYHVDEAIEGELLSVEGLSSKGKFTSLGLLSRILFSKNHIVEMGSCFPYPHSLSQKIISRVAAAHEALGITDGPTHTEVIVSPAGEVEIIDLNLRFVGADVLQSINHAFGMSVEELLLDFAIGKETAFKVNPVGYSCLQYVLPPDVSTFETISFPSAPEVKFTTSFLKAGTPLKSHDRQLDYLGCFLTVMPTFDQALARSRELRSQVRVNKTFEGSY